jgi:protein-disulfide isomerase
MAGDVPKNQYALFVSQDEERLTKAQRRDQARENRKALALKQEKYAVKKKLLIQLGSVLAVVVVAIAIIVGSSSSGGGGLATGKNQVKTVSEVTSLLQGIPQTGNTLGSPSAPVTLQYFGDLECPVCQAFTLSALPTVIQNYVRTGKVKIEYHSLETASRDPGVFSQQQEAAYAAGAQNKAWDYIELFYHEQGDETTSYVTPAYLSGLAKQVPGLNLASWNAQKTNSTYVNEVATDAQTAAQNNLHGTPSFIISGPGTLPQVFTPSSFTDPNAFANEFNKLLG